MQFRWVSDAVDSVSEHLDDDPADIAGWGEICKVSDFPHTYDRTIRVANPELRYKRSVRLR